MEPKRRRPLGIWMIIGLELFNAIIWIVDTTLGTNLSDARFQEVLAGEPGAKALVIGWALLVMLAAFLLWRYSRRGWALMMVLVGLSLLANLGTWWNDPSQTQWLSMFLSALVAFYLNSAAVRGLFLQKHEVSRLTLSERTRA